MKIIMGADPLGFELKNKIKVYLTSQGYEIDDMTENCPKDYYEVGKTVGQAISCGKYDRGLIFCGTGMGVNIVANKFPGVYCGLCESVMTARLCRIINNCNVLSMGGAIIGEYTAKQMADAFLQTGFSEGFSEATPAFLRNAFEHVKEIDMEKKGVDL